MNSYVPITKPDTELIHFRPYLLDVKYGDGRSFYEYSVLMFYRGKLAGIEAGPRRQTTTRYRCLKAAGARIAQLKIKRLFVIRVTRKHITDGEARNCSTCAIAQALWHNQERMGFDKQVYSFEVSPYAAFRDPRGVVIRERWSNRNQKHIPVEKLPKIAVGIFNDIPYAEGMAEWAMAFDDWAEARYMTRREWREERGEWEESRPCRPSPCSFVLDVDEFREFSD